MGNHYKRSKPTNKQSMIISFVVGIIIIIISLAIAVIAIDIVIYKIVLGHATILGIVGLGVISLFLGVMAWEGIQVGVDGIKEGMNIRRKLKSK